MRGGSGDFNFLQVFACILISDTWLLDKSVYFVYTVIVKLINYGR